LRLNRRRHAAGQFREAGSPAPGRARVFPARRYYKCLIDFPGRRTILAGMLRDEPPFRPEDRIRELCRKALVAEESELEAIFEELRAALHEHIERLRKIAVMKLARKELPVKKRSA
jgi:hypothetical protein